MSFLCLRCRVPQALSDRVSAFLESQGAMAVTLENAGDEEVFDVAEPQQPQWSEVEISGLFDAARDAARLLQEFRREFPASAPHTSWLADRDWEGEYRRHLKPIQVGRNLWVVPSDCPVPRPGDTNIIIDPGLAFGTGGHPSTALCLEWLSQARLVDRRILDYGCGSGILAIAALLLGASNAWGVDIDPRALEVSTDNARVNGVGDRYVACKEAALPESLRVDVVVANILLPVLLERARTLGRCVVDDGFIILAGIKEGQDRELPTLLPDFRFESRCREGWMLLIGRKTITARKPSVGTIPRMTVR